MGACLKKNFEEYANKMDLAAEVGENEEDEDSKAAEDSKFDLQTYDKLRNENGKNGATLFFSLLTKVFDEDMGKVNKYFEGYLI